MSGCWAEIWRQEWIGQKKKLRLPLLFGVDAGVIHIYTSDPEAKNPPTPMMEQFN